MTEQKIKEIIPQLTYTKEQVDMLIQAAVAEAHEMDVRSMACLLYPSPSPRDTRPSRMPSSA